MYMYICGIYMKIQYIFAWVGTSPTKTLQPFEMENHHWQWVNRGKYVLRSMAQGDLCVLVEGANWQIAGNPWVLIFKCIDLTKSWG